MRSIVVLCAAVALAWTASAQNQPTRVRRGNNLNISTEGNGETCADLKVTSSAELARANESFNLSRAEAPTLELNAGDRGVVSVRGWRQSGYAVEACKIAVAQDRGTADMMLRSMVVSHSAGRFSFTGPSGDSGSWQVHFIIHTPDNASLDLQTNNAPVAIKDVNGNIKVRATNGPVSIHGSTGNIDAQADSGPISFEGEGGEVHLMAQNGPISVKVDKDIWSGSKLDARTVHGPMSLQLPKTFQSGVRVETGGHTPISCQHDACDRANANLNGEQKIIQLNGAGETIHIATENGPLSIAESKNRRVF